MSTAYERYKQDLHSFFNGGKPLPGHIKEMLSTRPGASLHGMSDEGDASRAEADGGQDSSEKQAEPDKKQRRVVNGPSDDVLAIIERIRKASSPREVEAAVDALRGKGAALPKDDAEVLSKALGHGNEDVITEALRGLVDIEVSSISGLKSATLLKTRVKNVMLFASSTDVKDLGGKLLARLG